MYAPGQQHPAAASSMAVRGNALGQPGAQLTQQQLQQQQAAALQNQQKMGQGQNFPDTTKFVLDYLKRKGFSRSEAEFRLESAKTSTPPVTINNPKSSGSANVPQSIQVPGGVVPIGGPVSGPIGRTKAEVSEDMNWRAYHSINKWVDNSLDLYQPELRRVLYPIFVHLYLDLINKRQVPAAQIFFNQFSPALKPRHAQDLTILEQALHTQPSQILENELAKKFLENKYLVNMSRTTFDLVLFFLNKLGDVGGGSLIVRQLNDYFKICITSERPSRFNNRLESAEGFPETPKEQETKDAKDTEMANTESEGLPLALDFDKDIEMALGNEDVKPEIKSPEPVKEEPNGLEEPKDQEQTPTPTRPLFTLPEYKEADVMAEVRSVMTSRNKIKLGVTQASLPSVRMYTFEDTNKELNTLNFSPDASLVAGGFSNSFVKIWSLAGSKLQGALADDKPEPYKTLIGHSGAVYGLSFYKDNKYLLSASEDKSVRLWSMDTYSALVSYKGHSEAIWDVAFSPTNNYFATGSNDQTARLWSTDHIYPLRIFAGHLSDVDCLGWHPNGSYLVSGSSDKTCRMWDIHSGASVRVFLGHTAPVTCTAISPDGRWLASAGEDSVIHVWDLGSGRRLKLMKGHGKCSIHSLAFSPSGDILVSSGSDCTVRVWDIKKNTLDQGPEPESFAADGAGGASSVNSAASGGLSGGVSQGASFVNPLDGRRQKEVASTPDHLMVLNTKRTPVYKVQYTTRNVCIAGGVVRNYY